MKQPRSIQRQIRRGNVRVNPFSGMLERRSNKNKFNRQGKQRSKWVAI